MSKSAAASRRDARPISSSRSTTVNPKVRTRSRLVAVASGALSLALLLPPAAAQVPASDATPGCARWETQYAIAGTLQITETTMGAGNGTFQVGPGTVVLRMDTQAEDALLLRFDLHEHFAIHPNAVMWSATLVTDAAVHAAPEGTGAAASGQWSGGVLRWDSPLRNYRSDGALTCEGSLCGKFGTPPQGRSELHQTSAIHLQPFRFDREGQTFQMDRTLVSSSEAPHQRTYLALAGRRMARTCIQALPSRVGFAVEAER
jgi:hypothetical protein